MLLLPGSLLGHGRRRQGLQSGPVPLTKPWRAQAHAFVPTHSHTWEKKLISYRTHSPCRQLGAGGLPIFPAGAQTLRLLAQLAGWGWHDCLHHRHTFLEHNLCTGPCISHTSCPWGVCSGGRRDEEKSPSSWTTLSAGERCTGLGGREAGFELCFEEPRVG